MHINSGFTSCILPDCLYFQPCIHHWVNLQFNRPYIIILTLQVVVWISYKFHYDNAYDVWCNFNYGDCLSDQAPVVGPLYWTWLLHCQQNTSLLCCNHWYWVVEWYTLVCTFLGNQLASHNHLRASDNDITDLYIVFLWCYVSFYPNVLKRMMYGSTYLSISNLNHFRSTRYV